MNVRRSGDSQHIREPRPGTAALRIGVEENPSAADTDVILAGLRAFNEAHVGATERVSLAVFVRDVDGRVLGGLTAQVKYGWVHVDWLWLPDTLRGRGMGTAVMDAVEEDARRRGCVGAHVETTDYQALPFYEKRGYAVFGVLEGYPVGSRSYYLRKDL
jgi:GNAT superfamily N-acetyltransferase